MVRFFLLLLFLWIVLYAPSVTGQSPQTMQALEAINAKLRQLESEPIGINRALLQEKIAIEYSALGALEEGTRFFEEAARTLDQVGKPSKESYFNAGLGYMRLGAIGKAEKMLLRCLKIEPLFRHAHVKLASIYRDRGDPNKVQEHLLAAIQISPQSPDAYMYLADTYNNLKQFQLAIDQYKVALSLSGHPDAIATIACNMGDTYVNLKQLAEALKSYSQGKRQGQSQSQSRGQGSGQHQQASPSALACASIGYYYAAMEMGSWKGIEAAQAEAMLHARAVLSAGSQAPPTAQTPYRLLFHQEPTLSLVTAAKWSHALIAREAASTAAAEEEAAPTDALEAVATLNTQRTSHSSTSAKAPRLNIAYVSRRHHDYPGTQLMLRLFGAHDRTRVWVDAFSTGPNDSSGYRDVIRRSADRQTDLLHLTIGQGAAALLQARPDVVVDYDGAHDFNNLQLLQRLRRMLHPLPTAEKEKESGGSGKKSKKAQLSRGPVVATWLGFAGSTGLGDRARALHIGIKYGDRKAISPSLDGKGALPRSAIDYLLADNTILPPDSDSGRACTEHVVFLPHGCYQPQDEYQAADAYADSDEEALARIAVRGPAQPWKALAPEEVMRRKVELALDMGAASNMQALRAATGPWVACLNRVSKITPDAFTSYLQLLLAVPQARLVLLQDGPEVTRELRAVAAMYGVHSERILFFPRASKARYMQVLQLSALFADTRAYGSHTVASDALYMGLPVLTLPGKSFASRVGASLNVAAGAQETTAACERSWVQTGVRMLQGQLLTAELHDKIGHSARGVGNPRLFNSTAFAAGLERTYSGMHELAQMVPIGEPMRFHLFFESSLR